MATHMATQSSSNYGHAMANTCIFNDRAKPINGPSHVAIHWPIMWPLAHGHPWPCDGYSLASPSPSTH
eukprot:5559127-Lingulodinium_polyedra.AAC.1